MAKDIDSNLMKEYRALAKRADQRLVRLEKTSQQDGYSGVLDYAYSKAMQDIQGWSGEGAKRFNRDMPQSNIQLQAKINDIKSFLALPTSTKQGTNKYFVQRTAALNAKFGTNYTWQEWARFFEKEGTSIFETKGLKYNETAFQVLATISGKRSEKSISEAIESNQKIADKDVAKTIAKNLVKAGVNRRRLFK